MTILEKIEKIENLLNEYTNQNYIEEDLTSLKASVDELKAEIEAEKKAETSKSKDEADKGKAFQAADEAADWLLEKYAVKDSSNNPPKDRYTGNVDADADSLLDRIKSDDKIDPYLMQKSAKKY